MDNERLRRRALERLSFDSLGRAERVTGKSYEEDEETRAIGLMLFRQNSAYKRMLLLELNDTYWNMPWDSFVEIVDELGFELLDSTAQFAYERDGATFCPTELFAAHKGKKLLLHATSRMRERGAETIDETVDSATIYGAAYIRPDQEGTVWGIFARCSGGPLRDDNVYPFEFDAREGMVTRLMRIEEYCKLVDWNDPDRRLWLLNYSEENAGKSWETKRDQVFVTLPDWAVAFIGIR